MKRARIIYYFIRPIARIAMWVYYRKIHLSNVERIPVGKPVILSINHPTGFTEPILLAVFLKRPLYYLVRGDFFEKPVFSFLLRSLNMVPIFRRRDTHFRGVAQNLSTFEECYQTLRANHLLCIFPEGNTRHEKILRPLQKGLGRIAWGYLERFPDVRELYIVPVGVNYTYAEQPRSTVMIDFGNPINLAAMREAIPHGRMRVVSELTRTLYNRMADRIVRIPPDREEPAEHLLRLARSAHPEAVFPVRTRREEPLMRELAIARRVRQMDEEQLTELLMQSRPYFRELRELGLTDRMMIGPRANTPANTLLLLLGALPALAGYLFVWPPRRLACWIKDTKVKRVEFYTPVLQAAGLGAFLLYYILWLVLAASTGRWEILLLSLLLGILGYGSILWQELVERWRQSRKFRHLPEKDRLKLKQKRAALVQAVETRPSPLQ